MKANRGARLADDEVGAFPVVEAILVVILVLTAILFFTSVQRPTTGSDAGGIDLGRVAADTLRITQLRVFDAATVADGTPANAPYDGVDMTMEEWVTNLAAGDGSAGTGETAEVLDEFLGEILPTGARYSLRLSNGVASTAILPQGAVEIPQGATASEIMFLPDWTAFQDEVLTTPVAPASPGQLIVEATHDVLYDWITDPGIQCIRAPTGASTRPDGPDVGSAGDAWITTWRASYHDLDGDAAFDSGEPTFIPPEAPFGVWAAYSNAGCTAGPEYAKIVRDPANLRAVSDGVTFAGPIPAVTVLESQAADFVAGDAGKSVQAVKDGASYLAPGTTIASVLSESRVVVSGAGATLGASGVTFLIGLDNPYPPYGLQLVVWFGA